MLKCRRSFLISSALVSNTLISDDPVREAVQKKKKKKKEKEREEEEEKKKRKEEEKPSFGFHLVNFWIYKILQAFL